MNSIPELFNKQKRRHVWTYRNEQGEIIGYAARFDGDGKKDVVPYFKRNGDNFAAGGAIEPRPLFGLDVLAQADLSRAVFIVEGEKKAAALQSMGLVAITSQGGSNAANKADWTPTEGHRRVYLLPDNDAPGEHYAKTICAILAGFAIPPTMQIVRFPNLPVGGDVVDWIAAQLSGAFLDWDEFAPVPDTGMDMKWLNTEFKKIVEAHSAPVPHDWTVAAPIEQASDWQAPVSLTTATLPAWPDNVFPPDVQRFISGLAESTETPTELPALLVLATLAAAAQGKYRVRVKADYFEPVNVWTCVALPPASRKTAVQNAATAPLTAWERAQREIVEPLIASAQSEIASLSEQVKELRKQMKKAHSIEQAQLKKEIAQLEMDMPKVPTMPQVWAQDVTTEKLGALMSENNERMAVMSDEAGIFDILAGRYSGGVPNLDLYLQGHAGSPVKVDRGSRPSIFLQSPTLTLGLSPQPDVLRGLTDNKSFRGRGLLGRFLYAIPVSNLGYRTLNTRPLSDDCKANYERIVSAILNQEMATNADGDQVAHTLKLSRDAQQAWQAFAHRIEASMREGGTFAHITDWAGKFAGAMARVAALLHITRYAFENAAAYEINVIDMDGALRMADVLGIHALAAFDLMGADPALDGARHVLRWIEREGKTEFTFRDCHYAHKSRYKRKDELVPAIDVLVERHYIRQRIMKLVQGRNPQTYEINPAVLTNQT